MPGCREQSVAPSQPGLSPISRDTHPPSPTSLGCCSPASPQIPICTTPERAPGQGELFPPFTPSLLPPRVTLSVSGCGNSQWIPGQERTVQETTLGCSLLLPRLVFPQHKGWRPACTQCWDEEPNFSSGCWVPCGNLLVVLSEVALHPSLPRPPAVLSHGQLQLGCPAGPQQQARPDPWWRKQSCLPWDSCAAPPGARARPAARPQIFPAVAVAVFCSLALSRSLGQASQVCRGACSSSPAPGRLLHAQVLGLGKGFGAGCRQGEVMERSWAPAP